VGFYEAYDGKTGEPNNCRGLLMNNGGFIWGFFEAVLGIEVEGDELRFRAAVPKSITPARARLRYRDADFEIEWQHGPKPGARLDGRSMERNGGGYYRINLSPQPNQTYYVKIVTEDISSGRPTE
jgi:cellobiose phosphorylase